MIVKSGQCLEFDALTVNIYGRSRICNPVERIGPLTYIRRLDGGVLPPRQDEIRTSLPFDFVGLNRPCSPSGFCEVG